MSNKPIDLPKLLYIVTITKSIFLFQSTDPNEKFSGYIPLNKLNFTYSASSGPGGQNVNKV